LLDCLFHEFSDKFSRHFVRFHRTEKLCARLFERYITNIALFGNAKFVFFGIFFNIVNIYAIVEHNENAFFDDILPIFRFY